MKRQFPRTNAATKIFRNNRIIDKTLIMIGLQNTMDNQNQEYPFDQWKK